MANDFHVDKVNTIQAECVGYDSLLTATEWGNNDGFDISLTSKNGGIQHLSISHLEFSLLKEMIEKLDNL